MKQFYVYILANKNNGFLYIGMTSNLPRRIWEHKNAVAEGHTAQYSIKRLVYFETHDDFEQAALREKTLKKWRRAWKIDLIEADNPEWGDLYSGLAA